jgi:3-phosphoshikimate 1-carboxyvinyltransferase
VPGDKSISHRAAIISALARGSSQLTNFATSADCAATLSCLRSLGVPISQNGPTVRIEGVERGGFQPPTEPLDCGNSGSTMRMLAGVLAAQNFASIMIGDASLRSRPMGRVIEPLEMMGAAIRSTEGKPPLIITGRNDLNSIQYRLPVASAQVKSCVLLAGMHAKGSTEVIEQQPATRDHTERMLNWFGVPVETKVQEDNSVRISVAGGMIPIARDVEIPGDVSSSAFLIAAAALMPDSDLEIAGVGLNPTRTQFISAFQSLGLDVSLNGERQEGNEPVGTVRARGRIGPEPDSREQGNVLPQDLIPQLIDELPLLAVVATQVQGGITIRGARELRLKESDRIAATVRNLRAMGAEVEEFADGLSVPGQQKLQGGELDSFGDHRIAMAFTIAALFARSESELTGAECVAVSFPEFFETLGSVIEF